MAKDSPQIPSLDSWIGEFGETPVSGVLPPITIVTAPPVPPPAPSNSIQESSTVPSESSPNSSE